MEIIEYEYGSTCKFQDKREGQKNEGGKQVENYRTGPIPMKPMTKYKSLIAHWAPHTAAVLFSHFIDGARISLNQQLIHHQITISSIALLLGSNQAATDYLRKCIYLVGMESYDFINNYVLPQYYPTSSLYTPDQYATMLSQQQQLGSGPGSWLSSLIPDLLGGLVIICPVFGIVRDQFTFPDVVSIHLLGLLLLDLGSV
ncbi:GDSL esterase/lipase [Camellia lanceoleosa]|uniref:GDSL esterase/lipase n=1 Tax=Camellia lanceoleosa TaxID=1840588 RepID=A0ACC0FV62_9ERIC|nr:GDSL esterase/lipase [Camellia lanceoleosa]